MASAAQTRASDIPRAQQLPALSKAHVEGGLSVSRVSRILAGVGAVVVLEWGKKQDLTPGSPIPQAAGAAPTPAKSPFSLANGCRSTLQSVSPNHARLTQTVDFV